MKKSTLILVILFMVSAGFAQQKNARYAVKSGYIKYDITGNTKGTREIWWDNYGDLSRTEVNTVTTTRFLGTTSESKTHTLNIMKGDHFWSVNYLNNTAQKGTSSLYEETLEISESMTEAEAEKLGEDILASLGGERLGTESFLGKSCEIISVLGMKSWIYKGVLLKSEGNLLGFKTNEVAVKFDENETISASKFIAPTNVTYTEINY